MNIHAEKKGPNKCGEMPKSVLTNIVCRVFICLAFVLGGETYIIISANILLFLTLILIECLFTSTSLHARLLITIHLLCMSSESLDSCCNCLQFTFCSIYPYLHLIIIAIMIRIID